MIDLSFRMDGVAESQTWLSNWVHTHTYLCNYPTNTIHWLPFWSAVLIVRLDCLASIYFSFLPVTLSFQLHLLIISSHFSVSEIWFSAVLVRILKIFLMHPKMTSSGGRVWAEQCCTTFILFQNHFFPLWLTVSVYSSVFLLYTFPLSLISLSLSLSLSHTHTHTHSLSNMFLL